MQIQLHYATYSIYFKFFIMVQIQGDQRKMAVFFWYLVKRVTCPASVPTEHVQKSLYTRYQKNTAMFNWSHCLPLPYLGPVLQELLQVVLVVLALYLRVKQSIFKNVGKWKKDGVSGKLFFLWGGGRKMTGRRIKYKKNLMIYFLPSVIKIKLR